MKHLIKRQGHVEEFDELKLYASIFASVSSLRLSDEETESISHMVTHEVTEIIKNKKEVTAHQLHTEAAKSLRKYHPDAAYIYSTHKDVS
jgi:transcriptional regulator NrdR family protein